MKLGFAAPAMYALPALSIEIPRLTPGSSPASPVVPCSGNAHSDEPMLPAGFSFAAKPLQAVAGGPLTDGKFADRVWPTTHAAPEECTPMPIPQSRSEPPRN